jgi:phosphatidylinositol 3-kinase
MRGVGFPFYLSPQVRLDAKLKVVKLVDPSATMQPFYVTAQVFSCGVPMHGVTCSTSEPTAREAGSMRTVWWGHWITLPVQYKDVDRGSYIALKVFDGENREVASTRVDFFDEQRCMREGQQRLLLEVAAPLAGSDSDSGDGGGAAAEAAAAAAAARVMVAATPMMSDEDAEAEMREWMRLYRIKERHRKGQLDVPKCSWLDAMTFDHLSKVRARARAVERTCVQRAYLYVELPFFGHPVVYSEQPAQHHWFRYANTARAQRISLNWSKRVDGSTGRVYYVNLKSKAVQWEHPHVSADSDAGSASSGASAKSMVEDVPAWWRQELSLVFDPEEHHEVDVVERYFTKIARLTGGTAAAAPPSREQRRELALICTAPMFPGELEKREAELLWRFRHALTSDPKALTKFARCVDWDDASQVEEAMVLFHQWEESSAISVADALLLLAAEFKDAGVREFAVSVLERSDDDDLILYLLQLVQALRYEPQLKKLVEDGMPTETEAELAALVPLVRFLNTRARKNLALANNYNWYLQVEMSGHATTGESDGQTVSRLALEKMMYSMVCGSFHEVLRQNGQIDVLEYFRQQQDLLGKAYRVGMTRKGENADSKKARMIRDLQPDSFGDDAIVEVSVLYVPLHFTRIMLTI